jgi:hypothetical protein
VDGDSSGTVEGQARPVDGNNGRRSLETWAVCVAVSRPQLTDSMSARYTEREAEVAIAVLYGDLSVFKAQRVLGLERQATQVRLFTVIRHLVEERRLLLPRSDEDLLPTARLIAGFDRDASTARLQRYLRISYAQAARLRDQIAEERDRNA